MKLADLYLDRYLYRDSNQSSETKDSTFVSADSSESEPASIPAGGAAQDINISNVTIDGGLITPGTIPTLTLNISNYGWGQTCAFTSTDADTVSWGAGTFTSASGDTYSIGAGNTGNMAAKTYIYLDINVSEIAYQTTTTSSTAVGLGKVLIAVAENAAVSATYMLSEATQIVSDNIVANTIDASKITAGQLVVGTNVGLGTAEDSAGVTTIVGNVVTTGFVNALNVTAQYVVASVALSSPVITGGSIAIGTGNTIFKADSNGIYLGNATFASAPFRVTPAGALTATGVTVSGSITATSGSIAGSLVATGIAAGNITAGTLDADRIGATSIVAGKLNISTLSSITADMGTITAGTIKVSTRINIQKSDTTAVGYLGQDPDSAGLWGFVANRGYGLMLKYTASNYFRIFIDASASTDAIIDLHSADKLKIQDNSGAALTRFYGNTGWGGSPGGLVDLFHPLRLYTFDYGGGTTGGPEAGSYAYEGMMYVRLNYDVGNEDNLRVYVGGGWRSVNTT